jgi:hypothetical protein
MIKVKKIYKLPEQFGWKNCVATAPIPPLDHLKKISLDSRMMKGLQEPVSIPLGRADSSLRQRW